MEAKRWNASRWLPLAASSASAASAIAAATVVSPNAARAGRRVVVAMASGTATVQAQAGPCLSPACGSKEAERVVVERGGGERAELAVGGGGARSRQRRIAEQAASGGGEDAGGRRLGLGTWGLGRLGAPRRGRRTGLVGRGRAEEVWAEM